MEAAAATAIQVEVIEETTAAAAAVIQVEATEETAAAAAAIQVEAA